MKKTVGVLALQGDFEAHGNALRRAGARVAEVRTAAQLAACDGLVIPGGESTTMLKLLEIEGLFEPLRRFGQHKPIYGTCAGAILLARGVTNPEQQSLDLIDIDVERNAYGRQIDSRIDHLEMDEMEGEPIEAVFIRAPIIRRVGEEAVVRATYQGDPVWVENAIHMVTTFHPELTGDTRVYAHFLNKLMERRTAVCSMAS